MPGCTPPVVPVFFPTSRSRSSRGIIVRNSVSNRVGEEDGIVWRLRRPARAGEEGQGGGPAATGAVADAEMAGAASWQHSSVRSGKVGQPLRLTWEEFRALPETETTSDFHCVTRWSRLDNRWKGVLFTDVMKLVKPKPEVNSTPFHRLSRRLQ